jgi:ubiquinone/menaquinone biosynthesis C-methylase UbiE
MENTRKEHWEKIYATKQLNEVSWYQPTPETSLQFVKEFNLPKDAAIIDVGGGDSFLVDHLLDLGFTNVTVLDISEKAIERVKPRLGEKASQVKFIVADASAFRPVEHYDLWHDRAAFHFLTDEKEIDRYLHTVKQHLKPEGKLVIGTFSEEGPTKCSGIQIKQYSERTLSEKLEEFFHKIKCITVDHITPFNTVQNFLFCSFSKFQLH